MTPALAEEVAAKRVPARKRSAALLPFVSFESGTLAFWALMTGSL